MKSPSGEVSMKKGPVLFRITLEVSDAARAGRFYERLLGIKGRAIGGGRVYFDCGGVLLALIDAAKPGAIAQNVYFAVSDLDAVHARARALRCLSKENVHGEPGGAVATRPWGERSFYAVDRAGNRLCFVDRRTLFTGR
jgi:catechol 2,3-dioxygenase-like lactoylglutathione lyase family enzyme